MEKSAPVQAVAFSEDRRRSTACVFLTALVFVATVIVMRRVSGDASPLSQSAAALIGVVALSLSALSTLVPGVLRQPLDLPSRLLATGLASTPGLVLGLVLLPSGSVAGTATLLSVFCLAVVSGTLCGALPPSAVRQASLLADARRVLAARPRSADGQLSGFEGAGPEGGRRRDEKTPEPSPVANPSAGDSVEENLLFGESTPHPAEVAETVQWMSRSTLDEGEAAEGGCRAEFEAGQKVATIHIPFSPAFAAVPEMECEPLDHSDVTIKVAARQAYGVRLEVSRQGDCESPLSVAVGWSAFAESAAERSAAAA